MATSVESVMAAPQAEIGLRQSFDVRNIPGLSRQASAILSGRMNGNGFAKIIAQRVERTDSQPLRWYYPNERTGDVDGDQYVILRTAYDALAGNIEVGDSHTERFLEATADMRGDIQVPREDGEVLRYMLEHVVHDRQGFSDTYLQTQQLVDLQYRGGEINLRDLYQLTAIELRQTIQVLLANHASHIVEGLHSESPLGVAFAHPRESIFLHRMVNTESLLTRLSQIENALIHGEELGVDLDRVVTIPPRPQRAAVVERVESVEQDTPVVAAAEPVLEDTGLDLAGVGDGVADEVIEHTVIADSFSSPAEEPAIAEPVQPIEPIAAAPRPAPAPEPPTPVQSAPVYEEAPLPVNQVIQITRAEELAPEQLGERLGHAEIGGNRIIVISPLELGRYLMIYQRELTKGNVSLGDIALRIQNDRQGSRIVGTGKAGMGNGQPNIKFNAEISIGPAGQLVLPKDRFKLDAPLFMKPLVAAAGGIIGNFRENLDATVRADINGKVGAMGWQVKGFKIENDNLVMDLVPKAA